MCKIPVTCLDLLMKSVSLYCDGAKRAHLLLAKPLANGCLSVTATCIVYSCSVAALNRQRD